MLNLEVRHNSGVPLSNTPYYNNDEYTNEFHNTKCYNRFAYFLLCKSCFWCCTSLYFNKSTKRITKRPCCDGMDNGVTSMFVFLEKRKKKTYAINSFAPNQYEDLLLLCNDDTDVISETKRGFRMNISFPEFPMTIIAKTCNCNSSSPSSTANTPARKVTYTFVDSYYNLCIDKKDIILA